MDNQRKAATLFDNQGKGRFVTVDYIANILMFPNRHFRKNFTLYKFAK